eukprot:CAMPEP_0117580304 /NCGR_PEP_ID=MMETSP0784-20121206/65124_1 /TAXON_ID=39447 /ORGANISM="" /LENGTH=151 /DNA_ID=CAMNT_0005380343 /DNA_START=34 /DNA_END=485 /DNA_ORIENTATION=-
MGGNMGSLFTQPSMDPVVGAQAMTAAKIATAVAYKQAAYSMELAKHCTYAAMEMEHASQAIQRYLLGTSITTVNDVDAFAGQVSGGGAAVLLELSLPTGVQELANELSNCVEPARRPGRASEKVGAFPRPIASGAPTTLAAATASGVKRYG